MWCKRKLLIYINRNVLLFSAQKGYLVALYSKFNSIRARPNRPPSLVSSRNIRLRWFGTPNGLAGLIRWTYSRHFDLSRSPARFGLSESLLKGFSGCVTIEWFQPPVPRYLSIRNIPLVCMLISPFDHLKLLYSFLRFSLISKLFPAVAALFSMFYKFGFSPVIYRTRCLNACSARLTAATHQLLSHRLHE